MKVWIALLALVLFGCEGPWVEIDPVKLDKSPKEFASGILCVNADLAGADIIVRVRGGNGMWRGKTPRCIPVEKGGYTVELKRSSGDDKPINHPEVQVFPKKCVLVEGNFQGGTSNESDGDCPIKGSESP